MSEPAFSADEAPTIPRRMVELPRAAVPSIAPASLLVVPESIEPELVVMESIEPELVDLDAVLWRGYRAERKWKTRIRWALFLDVALLLISAWTYAPHTSRDAKAMAEHAGDKLGALWHTAVHRF